MCTACNPPARFPLLRHVGMLVLAASLAGGCSKIGVIDEQLSEHPTSLGSGSGAEYPKSIYSTDDPQVTLSVLFDRNPNRRGKPLMAEWLFPDGTVYLRVPARTERGSRALLTTSMEIRGEPPSRRPGTWRVRLSLDGAELLQREFEIRAAPGSHQAAGTPCRQLGWAAGSAGPGRSVATGAWVGGGLLRSTDATYAGMILLSSAAADCREVTGREPGSGTGG